jgi:hypothetical protein
MIAMTDLGPLSPQRRHRWDDGWVGRIIKLVGVAGAIAVVSFVWKGCTVVSDARAMLNQHTSAIADLKSEARDDRMRAEQMAIQVAFMKGGLAAKFNAAETAAAEASEKAAKDDIARAKTRPLFGAP